MTAFILRRSLDHGLFGAPATRNPQNNSSTMAPQQVQSCCASTFCCRSSSLMPSIRRRGRRGSTKCCACNRKCSMRRCIRVNSFALALMGVATFCARGDVLVRAYVCRPPLAARSLSLDVFFRNRSQSRLLSASTPDDAPMMSSTNRGQSRRDVLNVAAHLLGCLGAATIVSTWEDYDVTHLKPNRATLRQSYLADSAVGSNRGPSFIGSATKGLAWNEADRETNAYELQFGDQAGRDIQSYNEIMDRHREERVPTWKRDANNRPYLSHRSKDSATAISESDAKKAVEAVYDALRAVLQLKVLAKDYDWDAMAEILDGPVLVSDLERAAAPLRRADGPRRCFAFGSRSSSSPRGRFAGGS